MADSYANAATMDPLPFVVPSMVPRPLLSECMLRSTFLFPNNKEGAGAEEMTTPRLSNISRGNAMADSYANAATMDPLPFVVPVDTDRHSFRPTAKKSVRFETTPDLYPLAGPCASDMTADEKQDVWYGATDYDRFKCLAATLAGVIITRHCDNHRFVMTGYFKNGHKGKEGGKLRSDTSVAAATHSSSHAISKRGLGYHFSRRRKQARAAARAAIVTWQKKLRGATTGADVQIILAYTAEKLSCRARGEAQWRGEADFGAAYPELRRIRLPPHPPPPSMLTRLPSSMTPVTKNGGVASATPHFDMDGIRKRRRIEGRGCVVNEGNYSRGNRRPKSEVTQA